MASALSPVLLRNLCGLLWNSFCASVKGLRCYLGGLLEAGATPKILRNRSAMGWAKAIISGATSLGS
jgi:hypothetical protein